MTNDKIKILRTEKIVSVLSYVTMGIIGLIWIIIAHFMNRKIKYFLLYNIVQSMIISIILAIFKLLTDILLLLVSKIHFLDFLAAIVNLLISVKIVRFQTIGLSFSLIELLVFLLLVYICIGIFFGRIFYIPFLTDFMQKILRKSK